MIKYVAISLIAIFLMACTGNKNSYFSEEEKEDSNAKEMLQGIWLDDETESPLMRVEGDTIFYADSQSAPIAFKIIRDTLYTYGNDTTYYKIDKKFVNKYMKLSETHGILKERADKKWKSKL